MPAKVYTVEPTGDVTFVQVFLSGAIVNISLPPTFDVGPDEQVWLEFDQNRMHLFDGETELALQDDHGRRNSRSPPSSPIRFGSAPATS